MAMTRIRLASAAAVVALAISVVTFGGTPGAVASDPNDVVLGTGSTTCPGVNCTNATTIIHATGYNQDGIMGIGDASYSGSGVVGKGAYGVSGSGVYGVHGDGLVGVLADGTEWGVRAVGTLPFGIGVEGTAGDKGVKASGGNYGVEAYGGKFGVSSSAGAGGTGVFGENSGATGIGVHGRTGGTGSAVFGEATKNGVGVNGKSVDGTAVRATSTNGIGLEVQGKSLLHDAGDPNGALEVFGKGIFWGSGLENQPALEAYGRVSLTGPGDAEDLALDVAGKGKFAAADAASGTALEVVGKATFSRSGVTTVSAGKASRRVAMEGVSPGSMVLATAQQSAAVYVKAVVPVDGSFVIRLTGRAPQGGLRVAYFVLN